MNQSRRQAPDLPDSPLSYPALSWEAGEVVVDILPYLRLPEMVYTVARYCTHNFLRGPRKLVRRRNLAPIGYLNGTTETATKSGCNRNKLRSEKTQPFQKA